MNSARPSRVLPGMSPRLFAPFAFAGALALGAACAFGVTVSADARAEDHFSEEHFDLAVAPGSLTLTTKGEFHINQDYPWKLVVGDVKLDKTKFVLSEKTASITGAPKGKALLKGAVCSKDQCHKVEKEVTIQ
jgi:hypothetical protein